MTIRLARAVHRLALAAYPRPFRQEFGAEIDRIFIERLQGARQHSRRRAAAVACYHVGDAIMSGVAERTRVLVERWAWPRHFDRRPFRRSNTMTFESMRDDLRLALRQGRRAPMFAVLTIASLALGMGATSAMFGVVRAVLLRPLPYSDPDSLVMIWSDNTKSGEKANPVSPANIEAFRAIGVSRRHRHLHREELVRLEARVDIKDRHETPEQQPAACATRACVHSRGQAAAGIEGAALRRRGGGSPDVCWRGAGAHGTGCVAVTRAPRHASGSGACT